MYKAYRSRSISSNYLQRKLFLIDELVFVMVCIVEMSPESTDAKSHGSSWMYRGPANIMQMHFCKRVQNGKFRHKVQKSATSTQSQPNNLMIAESLAISAYG